MSMPNAIYLSPVQQLPTPPQQQQLEAQGVLPGGCQRVQQLPPPFGHPGQNILSPPLSGPAQIPRYTGYPLVSGGVPDTMFRSTRLPPVGRQPSMAATMAQATPSSSSSSLISLNRKRHRGTSGPRKKRECPICHNFYSNLTTHKSIHNKGSKPYACTTCSRAFKRLNDLIRHEKCHLSKLGAWEYQCPFHPGQNSGVPRGQLCHQTGYFTRCDTYKNHLKAIHFKYPPNTLKSERSKVSGHCKECGMFFNSVQEWLKTHIENNACPKIINFNNSTKRR